MMKFKVELRDDNGNAAIFHTDDRASIEMLSAFVKAAAGTEGYERFAKDGAIIVHDDAGTEVAHIDGRTGWSFG